MGMFSMIDRGAPALTLDDGLYAPCRAEIEINMEAKRFFDWYMNEPVENYMLRTLLVPSLTGFEMLEGPDWGKKDSARKLFFTDGTICLERILEEDFPRSYSYQPWAYDNPVSLISNHAHSTMRAEDVDGCTRIVWDYAFHAKNRICLPPLKLFMAGNWRPHLEAALARMRDHLETAGPDVHMHEAAETTIAA